MTFCNKVLGAERALDRALDDNSVATIIEIVAMIGLLWALSTMLGGCAPQPGDNYYDIDVVVEAPAADDDDSAGEEEPIEPSDDDDSAVEEIEEITFRVGFSTAWSASGMLEVEPGATANLGAFLFDADGGEIRVLEIEMRMMYLDNVQFGSGFMIGGNNSYVDEVIDAHIEWCALNHVFTGSTFAGPVAPQDGILRFENEFVLPNNENEPEVGEKAYLNVICKFSELEPQGESDAFAIQLFAPELTIPVEGTQGETIAVDYWSMNGNGQFPMLAAVLVSSMVEPPSVYIGMNAASPYGAAVPGWNDIFRFDICAGPESAIEITNIKFAIPTTDNAATGWNTCGELGSANKFTLYNITNGWTLVTAGLSFVSSYDNACNLESSVVLGSFNALISNEVIAAGTCSTYELWADSSGASSVGDDVIQATIFSEEWFTWNDEDGNEYDGSDTNGSFPIIGHMLVF